MSKRESFVFYTEWQDILMEYPAEVRLEVYDAIITYAATGTLVELKPLSKMAFSFMKKVIDRNIEKFETVSDRRSRAAKKAVEARWNNNHSKDDTKKSQSSSLPITDATTLDEEIDEMKSSEVWLDSMQNLHHMNVDEIKEKLGEFKLKCIADGMTSHEDINDAKKHFNNWLRIVSKNDKVRTDSKAGRRGNLLKADEKKTYSNSF